MHRRTGACTTPSGEGDPNKWRTLTTSEWQYLFKKNKWTLEYIQNGVNPHLCFMLISEGFAARGVTSVSVISTSLSLSNGYVTNISASSYEDNDFFVSL